MRNTTLAVIVALVELFALPVTAKVRVVSATTDIASIAAMIGGDNVEIETVCRGTADPHFIQILPSYMVAAGHADIYLRVGMGLDFWSNAIIESSGNKNLLVVDCSGKIEPLETPGGAAASPGHIHVRGNPHYWLDPKNGILIAEVIAEALGRVDPGNAETYGKALNAFRGQIEARRVEWHRRAAPLRGLRIVTYHDSWPYFARAFGIDVVGFVEPRPGVEPTPSHTAAIIDLMNAGGVRIIGRAPYLSDRAVKTIADQTDAAIVEIPASVGGDNEATDYFTLFDVLIDRLAAAAARAAGAAAQ